MKTLRIILIVLLVLYGLGALMGAIFSLFSPAKQAKIQQLGEMTPATLKMILLSGAMLAGQVWIYFSALALLSRNMKEGYMYAITLGFIELVQAVAIVITFGIHQIGGPTNYLALIKGVLLLAVALTAFKKQQTA